MHKALILMLIYVHSINVDDVAPPTIKISDC